MAKTREQKEEIIKELEEDLSRQKSVVFSDFNKVNSISLFELRNKLKEEGCLLKIPKKTLLIKTLEKMGKKEIADKVRETKEQLALVFGFDDELKPSKLVYAFSLKNENFKILYGVLDNNLLSEEEVIALAKLPSKEEILSGLVWSLNYPASSFVYLLKANIKGLVVALNNIAANK